MSVIERILVNAGLKEQESVLVPIYRKIEQAGGIDLLRDHCLELRKNGDASAIVLMDRTSFWAPAYAHLLVQLHWGLEKASYLSSSWWISKGVGLEATLTTPPVVRFTDGNSWSYLDKSEESSLNEQVMLAMKLARLQHDYRYGEGEGSIKQKLTRSYKVII